MSARLEGRPVIRHSEPGDDGVGHDRAPSWQRLDKRMIWVDAARTGLSLVPGGLGVGVFGVQPGRAMWPLLLIAAVGLLGAIDDALRWVKTWYRVTDEYVEQRTGLLTRKYRSVRRDRIRSVDTKADLRHRIAGLRRVVIGAGQQAAAGESALTLDAVSTATADELRRVLLDRSRPAPGAEGGSTATAAVGDAGSSAYEHGDDQPVDDAPDVGAGAGGGDVVQIARLRRSWLPYNALSIGGFAVAAVLLGSGYWLAWSLGLDPGRLLTTVLDPERFGWPAAIALGVSATGIIGVIGLGVVFLTEHWGFRLTRVPTGRGTALRTSQGLFTTRVVNRDDDRMRGVSINEPLLWRWAGIAEVEVIGTGLAAEGDGEDSGSRILPRCPRADADRVAAAIIRDEAPLEVPLPEHPSAALRRRVARAVAFSVVLAGLLGWLASTIDAIPGWAWLAGPTVLPLGLGVALLAYRALGHARSGDHLVIRSGMLPRQTAILDRGAVIGLRLRQSVLQRRLGLLTVTATTAAGSGAYDVFDADTTDAIEFAEQAVPDLLTPFLERP